MIYIALDPGITGGIAIFDVEEDGKSVLQVQLLQSLRVPSIESFRYKTKKSKRIHVEQLNEVLTQYQPTHGCVELVSAMPAQNKLGKAVQGATSTFNFGYTTGMAEGILYAHGIKLSYVTASVWKRHFNLLKTTKMDAVNLANAYWPNFKFTRPCDSGRADAALIGFYGISTHFK